MLLRVLCILGFRGRHVSTQNSSQGVDDDLQVWDLLAPVGKQELELVKSIGGFDIPDLTQIGKPCPPDLRLA